MLLKLKFFISTSYILAAIFFFLNRLPVLYFWQPMKLKWIKMDLATILIGCQKYKTGNLFRKKKIAAKIYDVEIKNFSFNSIIN